MLIKTATILPEEKPEWYILTLDDITKATYTPYSSTFHEMVDLAIRRSPNGGYLELDEYVKLVDGGVSTIKHKVKWLPAECPEGIHEKIYKLLKEKFEKGE